MDHYSSWKKNEATAKAARLLVRHLVAICKRKTMAMAAAYTAGPRERRKNNRKKEEMRTRDVVRPDRRRSHGAIVGPEPYDCPWGTGCPLGAAANPV